MIEVADEDFASYMTEQLALIEDQLLKVAADDNPFVTEVAQHIISAGGKRFRPGLVVVAAQFGQPVPTERMLSAALVMELTHVASVYHDDVMDEAQLRRSTQSANARYGNSVAILVGDFLFARASGQVAKLGPEYVALQAQTFARLVQGQIAETLGPSVGDDPLQHYLNVIDGKTAALIQSSALFGGMIAQSDPVILDALGRFGREIGIVFQLSDDLIDVTSDSAGKAPGTDLREGVPTLPVLLLRPDTEPADAELVRLIKGGLSSDAELADALSRLRANPVIELARTEISRRAEIARGYLAPLPDGAAKRALDRMCDEVVERSR